MKRTNQLTHDKKSSLTISTHLEKYFYKVEYDSTTNLERLKRLDQKFAQLKRFYLKDINLSKITLRFRRLGNIKAMAFYSDTRCPGGTIVLDCKMPARGFVHELGHAIDYL